MTCHSCWWHWPWWCVAQHQRQEKSRAQVSNVPFFFCSATHWLPMNNPSPLLRDVGSINIATAPSPGENSMQTGQRRQRVWTPITRAEDEEEKGWWSPECKRWWGQMKEGPGKHPKPTAPTESQIADPPHACQGFSPCVKTHGSTWNTTPARPPWMQPDHHGDGEPQQQRVNDPDDGLTPVAAG